jgi:toxin FitB
MEIRRLLILDTNVVSELMHETPNSSVTAWLNAQVRRHVWVTAITIMELHQGILALPPGRRRSTLRGELDQVITESIGDRVASFDDAAAQVTASLMAQRKRAGRPGDLRDSMIAGIALATGAALATRNIRHFADLSITLIDPWTA